MPRGRKPRRVCFIPECRHFIARGGSGAMMSLELDELESLRLADYEGMEQDEAAAKMGVSRGTFQRILYAARRKAAGALVNGFGIRIGGGDYELQDSCPGSGGRCRDCRAPKQTAELKGKPKGGAMIIAVTSKDGEVFQHFGQCQEFTVFETEEGLISSKKVVKAPAEGHGANAGILKDAKAGILICGGIGPGAMDALKELGIEVVPGQEGDVNEAVKKYLLGEIGPEVKPSCGGHSHEHKHEGGHERHGCGGACKRS